MYLAAEPMKYVVSRATRWESANGSTEGMSFHGGTGTDMEKEKKKIKVLQEEPEPVNKNTEVDDGQGDQGKDTEKSPEKMTKPELIEKLKEIQEEGKRHYDLYLRSQADTENMKKRHQREKTEWVKYANETIIKELLPVIDNLEMALSHAGDDQSVEALRQGVELTLKGFKDALGKAGLEEVNALGEPFDPAYHEAVSQTQDESVEHGRITHEIQRGYLLNERLIRPARVVVNMIPSGEENTLDG
jgi:molecular chaperone GrpE